MSSSQNLFTVYIDIPFLKNLLRDKPDPIEDLDDDWLTTWKSVFSFLRRNARVVVDGKEEEVFDNQTLTTVLLSGGQTESVEFAPGIADEINGNEGWLGEDPFSVFLFESSLRPALELRRRTGLLFLEYNELGDRWPSLFESNTLDVGSDTSSFEWGDLALHARPLNSVIVVDKYAYGQLASPQEFEKNLGGLFGDLLPDHQPDHPLHIAIFTDLQKAMDENQYRIGDLFETAQDFLDSHFGHIDIRLRLLGLDRDQHEDRLVFTNYGVFSSGDSFDYFRKNGNIQKDTLVKYLPVKGHESEVERRLTRFGRINFDPPNGYNWKGSQVRLAKGDPQNRLLDWVQGISDQPT